MCQTLRWCTTTPMEYYYPSSNDVFFTKELISILKPLNVKIEDHIIISGTQYISMREMELLDDTE